jgi:hypothetical protein
MNFAVADALPLDHVASQFESLGGGSLQANGWAFGCEFGFFQRHAGIEPMGLLRWASIASEDLIEGLRNRFEGVGDVSLLELRAHTGQDWGATQTRYRIYLDHSNIDRKSSSEEEAKRKICTGLAFLRNKLLEDLENGDKIFVYRTYDHVLSNSQLDRLANAVNSYGPNLLLYVTQCGSETPPPFTAEMRRPGLLVGYIDHFAPGNGELVYNNSGWEAVCRAAIDARHHPVGRS